MLLSKLRVAVVLMLAIGALGITAGALRIGGSTERRDRVRGAASKADDP
jgi:hypothetical protein